MPDGFEGRIETLGIFPHSVRNSSPRMRHWSRSYGLEFKMNALKTAIILRATIYKEIKVSRRAGKIA